MQEASFPLKENPHVYCLKTSVEWVQQFNRKVSILTYQDSREKNKAVNEVSLQSKKMHPEEILCCFIINSLLLVLATVTQLQNLGTYCTSPLVSSVMTFDPTFSISNYSVTPTVAHNCHGKANRSRQRQIHSRQKLIAHGKVNQLNAIFLPSGVNQFSLVFVYFYWQF